MVSKAERIRNMTREGVAPAEIAEELDTTTSYVYKVRSDMGNSNTSSEGAGNSEPSPSTEETGTINEPSPDTESEVAPDSSPSESGLEFEEGEESEERDLPDADDDLTQESVEDDHEPERDDLELDDDGPKSYECGGCDATVEYLDRRCDGCGERLMWSAIGGQ